MLLIIAASSPYVLLAQDCDMPDHFEPDSTWAPQEADFMAMPWYDNPAYLPAFYDSLINALDGSNPATRIGPYGLTPLLRIPVRFWVYRDDNGLGGNYAIGLPRDNHLQLILDNVNEAFVENEVRIQLYLHSIRNIDNSRYMREMSGTTRTSLAIDFRLKGVLNAHIIPEGNGLYTGLAPAIFLPRRVYNPLSDGGINTVTHEVGHYLGLWHTHTSYAIPCQQEPVERGVYARLGCSVVPRRWCSITGDGFCDTPADPNMSTLLLDDQPHENGCLWTADLQDNRGDDFAPMIDNYMAYANHPCRNRFTGEQKMAMLRTALTRANKASKHEQNYLNNPDNQVDFFEPDNSPRTAREVDFGATHPRSFHFSGQRDERDWYRFQHPFTGSLADYTITVSNYDGLTVGDVTVFPLVDGSPGPALRNLPREAVEGTGNYTQIRLACTALEPGRTYLIRISRGSNRTGEYTFRMDQPGEEIAIAGPATLCEEKTGTYSLSGLHLLSSQPGIQWSATSNIKVQDVSEDKTQVSVRAWFAATTTERITATLSSGCGTKTIRSEALQIGTPSPMGPVAGPTTASEGAILHYYGDASAVQRAESYVWTLPYSTSPCAPGSGCWEVLSQNGASYLKAAAGSQSGYVQVAPVNYCGSGIPTVTWVTVSSGDGSGGGPSVWEKTVLSPNPGQGDTDMAFPGAAAADMPAAYTVQVFDLNRVLLYERSYRKASIKLPTSQLKAGLYIIQIISPEGVQSMQFLKE